LPSNPTSVAVIGCGAFGRNHARVYAELERAGEPLRLANLVDQDRKRAERVAADLHRSDIAIFGSVDELLTQARPDAASVAVPTAQHLTVARPLLEAGVDLLIEKPLAASLGEADELVALAAKHHRVAQVGHLERFNPGVRAAVPLVTHPMFFEVHRLSMFGPRALDVDVVLDLMVHDLDVVLWLVRSPVREVRAVGLPVLSGKVDIANVRIEFETGCVANFTASRVSTERVRKLRFFQPHQYISIDYSRQDVFSLTVEPADKPPAQGGGFPAISLPAGLRIVPAKPQVVAEEPLRAELRSFIAAVRERATPAVSLAEGRAALALALEILAAIHAHAERANVAQLAAR